MNPVAASTAAVLVAFRPAAPPVEMLRRLGDQVSRVVIVDNAAQPRPALADAAAATGATLLHNANAGGLAGAYNRALAHLRGLPEPPQQVLWLDEDSDTSGLDAFLSDPATQLLLTDDTTAAVSPAYRDRATGLRGKFIELARWRLRFLPRQFDDVRAVAFVINSMSLWRMRSLERIGAFDEALAVDHVDTDYCLRARALGLRVFVHGGHEFAHAIGQRRTFRLLGREMQAGGHPPARRFTIGRNTVWLARRWIWREPAFAWLCLARLGYETVGIVLAEDHAWGKLAALWYGALQGLVRPRR